MTDRRRRTGDFGEERAVQSLRKAGYRVLSRNYRCRYGEVDVVAEEGTAIVFIEVKTRRGEAYGPPALGVTRAKQRRLIRTALHYLMTNRLEDRKARFDVVAIVRGPEGWRTELLRGAFDAREWC